MSKCTRCLYVVSSTVWCYYCIHTCTTVDPEATDVSVSPSYFVAGTNVILIAFINIEGNPEPNSTWTVNANAISSTDIRFDTSVSGQLSITNISSVDVGTYMCTLSNGDPTYARSATIELSEAGKLVVKYKKLCVDFIIFDFACSPSYHA